MYLLLYSYAQFFLRVRVISNRLILEYFLRLHLVFCKSSKIYRLGKENVDLLKNMLLLKYPQFLPNHFESRSKWGTHKYLILTELRNDWLKIGDFLIKAYFWFTVRFFASHLIKGIFGVSIKAMFVYKE